MHFVFREPKSLSLSIRNQKNLTIQTNERAKNYPVEKSYNISLIDEQDET